MSDDFLKNLDLFQLHSLVKHYNLNLTPPANIADADAFSHGQSAYDAEIGDISRQYDKMLQNADRRGETPHVNMQNPLNLPDGYQFPNGAVNSGPGSYGPQSEAFWSQMVRSPDNHTLFDSQGNKYEWTTPYGADQETRNTIPDFVQKAYTKNNPGFMLGSNRTPIALEDNSKSSSSDEKVSKENNPDDFV